MTARDAEFAAFLRLVNGRAKSILGRYARSTGRGLRDDLWQEITTALFIAWREGLDEIAAIDAARVAARRFVRRDSRYRLMESITVDEPRRGSDE